MVHAEVLIVTVLMLADCVLTVAAARMIGATPEERAAYELNPAFRADIGRGSWLIPRHLLGTAVVTSTLWLAASIFEPAQYQGALGLCIGAMIALTGNHAANLMTLLWTSGNRHEVTGRVATSYRYRLITSTFQYLGLCALPLAAIAFWTGEAFTIGAACGAALIAFQPLLWSMKLSPEDLDRKTALGGNTRACSFCGRSAWQLKTLIEADHSAICDECVVTCQEVLAEEERTAAPAKSFGRKQAA